MTDRNNKVTVAAGLATVLLLACMAAVEAADQQQGGSDAVTKFCAGTDYKETCMKSVEKANSTEPKDLIKAALNSGVAELQRAIKSTGVYKRVKSDKMTQGALAVCEETLNTAVEDLRRSFDKVDKIENGKLNYNMADLRNWLTATSTNRETCIDAFQNTTGDTGKKIKELLKTSDQLLSNSLSMITQLQKVLSSFDFGAIANKVKTHVTQRELLGDESEDEEIPAFVDMHARKLMDAAPESLKKDVTVAQDGSGQFKTINDAIKSLPAKNTQRIVLFVKAGVYQEYVLIPKGLKNLFLIGEGPLKTIITGSKSYAGGVKTFHSATLTVTGDGFMAKDIAIENTAKISQAVALRVSAQAVLYNCHINGYQDTLYAHSYKQFYRDCRISGTVDFTFGNAVAVFQNCDFVARKHPGNGGIMVTAQGRVKPTEDGVIVIQGSRITAEDEFLKASPPQKAYLGRPWKKYARVIVMETDIGGCIQPEGWSPWDGTLYLDTLYYAEWGNRGDGSGLTKRPVNWPGYQKDYKKEQAQAFLPQSVFVNDLWIKDTGVPYVAGFIGTPLAAPK